MTEREAIESTYFDRCDVYRRSDVKDPDTKQTGQTESAVLQNLPCALSQNRRGEFSLGGNRGEAAGGYTLFCSPNADIRKGDKIRVTTAAGRIYALWAGKGFSYAESHSEIPLSEE